MKTILITGSCGFIGSNLMRYVMQHQLSYHFVSIDKVIEPYNLHNVKKNQDHVFYLGDIADPHFIDNIFNLERPHIVLHLAAESFVDSSIKSAGPFIHSNVVGTQVLIDAASKYGVERFFYVSTDEVYGHHTSSLDLPWTEDSLRRPRNPYSASKLAGELIVYAANQTHGLPFNISRCCNNFGPGQPPRNLVPKIISCLLKDQPIPIHGDGKNIREWIYVEDHILALFHILHYGEINQVYNIGTGVEYTNLELVNYIAKKMNKTVDIKLIKDRPGHDFRYAVNFDRLSQLGWQPQSSFAQGMEKCLQWYLDNYHTYYG